MSAALVRRSASESRSAGSVSALGMGREVRAGARTARRARSRAAMLESRKRPGPIRSATIIEAIPAPTGGAGRDALHGGLAFALAHLLEYTSPPFLARPAGT